jgi:hypothetical protein
MPEPEYTAAERQRIEALDAALEESDNYDDENQFQQELEDLEAAAVNRQLTPEFKAGLGIVVSMSRDGSDFYIQRAIGKVEDLPKTRSQDADVTNENGVITLRQPDIKADAFSANLVETLSAERSLVTQAVLATSPKVSMALLTWTFCREVFEGDWCTGVQAPLCINLHQQTWTLQSNAPSGREGGMAGDSGTTGSTPGNASCELETGFYLVARMERAGCPGTAGLLRGLCRQWGAETGKRQNRPQPTGRAGNRARYRLVRMVATDR